MGKKSSIYLSADLSAKLRVPPRGPSKAVSATIDRYYALIASERKRLEAVFTAEEWWAMRNACNGTWWEPAEAIRGGVLANIQDSLDIEITEYGAERKKLEAKLAELSVVGQFALVEMIEEYWERQGTPEEEPSD